jgi:uncharacterized protein YjiS (DUF1127 family)
MAYITTSNSKALGSTRFGFRSLSLSSLKQMAELARQRRQLEKMPANRLLDMGLSAEQACTEANRRFWDAPKSWRA